MKLKSTSKSLGSSLGLLLLTAALLGLSLSACNTIEGAGKDIKSAGRAIEKAADDDDDDN